MSAKPEFWIVEETRGDFDWFIVHTTGPLWGMYQKSEHLPADHPFRKNRDEYIREFLREQANRKGYIERIEK